MRFKSYEPAEMMLSYPSSIKKGCLTCQWLDNVDKHLYAKEVRALRGYFGPPRRLKFKNCFSAFSSH